MAEEIKKIATRDSYGSALKALAAEGHDDLYSRLRGRERDRACGGVGEQRAREHRLADRERHGWPSRRRGPAPRTRDARRGPRL